MNINVGRRISWIEGSPRKTGKGTVVSVLKGEVDIRSVGEAILPLFSPNRLRGDAISGKGRRTYKSPPGGGFLVLLSEDEWLDLIIADPKVDREELRKIAQYYGRAPHLRFVVEDQIFETHPLVKP